MLEMMTKERMKKGGDVKRRPDKAEAEGDQREEQSSPKPGSDDDVRKGKDLAQLPTDVTRCLTRVMRNVFDV